MFQRRGRCQDGPVVEPHAVDLRRAHPIVKTQAHNREY
jgi:hypothetical protein